MFGAEQTVDCSQLAYILLTDHGLELQYIGIAEMALIGLQGSARRQVQAEYLVLQLRDGKPGPVVPVRHGLGSLSLQAWVSVNQGQAGTTVHLKSKTPLISNISRAISACH